MGLLDYFRTKPAPVPDRAPRGTSGRQHNHGYLELEETNPNLQGWLGLREYDRMYRTDGDVRQSMGMCINPIVSGTWDVHPYGGEKATEEDRKIARAVKWALWDVMEPNIITHLAEILPVLLRSGFATSSQGWTTAEFEGQKLLAPQRLQLLLPRSVNRWIENNDGTLNAIEQFPSSFANMPMESGGVPVQGGASGNASFIIVPAEDLCYYRVGAEGNNWEGVSMLRPAYKHWKLKDAIERIDAIAQEREAVGIPICYPPMGATVEQLEKVEELLAAMRTNEQGYIVAPGPYAGDLGDNAGQGWRFDILSNQGKGRDPSKSLDYHTHKVAAAFITEFMRLGQGSTGARATAQVQADPFLQAVEALVTAVIEPVINDTLVARFVALNFGKAKNLPRVKMSLVDATSLNDLADFITKTVMVGALIPDPVLESFIRERADLPSPDPDSVKQRDKEMKDWERRSQLLTGGGSGEEDPFGANAKPGKPHGIKPAKTSGGAGGPTMKPAKSLDREDADHSLGREMYPFEYLMDIGTIEHVVDTAKDRFDRAARSDVIRLARRVAQGTDEKADRTALSNSIYGELTDVYEFGRSTVSDEIARQRGHMHSDLRPRETVLLDSGKDDDKEMRKRADLAAKRISDEVNYAAEQARLRGGDDAAAQAAAEAKATRALREAANANTMAALNQGRLTGAIESGYAVLGGRYTAILDSGTCSPCAAADDGELRPLDDPVLMANMPPNPNCQSTLGGDNMCRCMIFFEIAPDFGGDTATYSLNWVSDAGGLPSYIKRIKKHLVDGGMEEGHAIATAVNAAKKMCGSGDLNFPGVQKVNPGSRAEACAAVTDWERKKAQARAS